MAWEDDAVGVVYTGMEPGLQLTPMLGQPVWEESRVGSGPAAVKVEAPAGLLTLLTQIEAVLRRMAAAHNDPSKANASGLGALSERAEQLGEQLSKAFNKLKAPDPNFTAYLQRTKLARLFPRTLAMYRMKPKMSLPLKRIPMDSYFAHLSVLNQLLSICDQITDDVNVLANHKYIAHQIALLYQCLSLARSPMDKFRAEVQDKFADVKEASKALEQEPGRLPVELAGWLLDVLQRIKDTVKTMPDIYAAPLQPVARYLHGCSTGSY